jgi:hypothetical protein
MDASRRSLLGMLTLVGAAPQATGQAVTRQLSERLGLSLPFSGGDDGPADVCSSEEEVELDDVLSVAHKTLLAQRQTALDELELEISARRRRRKFLYSMSPAAKEAYDRQDRELLYAQRSELDKFTDSLYAQFLPEHWRAVRFLSKKVLGPGSPKANGRHVAAKASARALKGRR